MLAVAVQEAEPMVPLPLTPAQDNPWLEKLIPDPQALETLFPELQRLASLGSVPLRNIADEADRAVAFAAREQFMFHLGIEENILERLRHRSGQRAYLGPTATFIQSQRRAQDEGWDVDLNTVLRRDPSLLNVVEDSWYERLQRAQAYIWPNVDPGPAIQTSIDHLIELGLDPKPLYAQHRPASELSRQRADQRLADLGGLGVDALRVIRLNPDALFLKIDTIASKVENLDSLGLNGAAIVTLFPNILSAAESSVARKVQIIRLGAKALRWDGDPNELMQASPQLLTSSEARLMLLLRIAAIGAHVDRRQMKASQVADKARLSLEYYILALDERQSGKAPGQDVFTLARRQQRKSIPTAERKRLALAAVRERPDAVGKIATRYLQMNKK